MKLCAHEAVTAVCRFSSATCDATTRACEIKSFICRKILPKLTRKTPSRLSTPFAVPPLPSNPVSLLLRPHIELRSPLFDRAARHWHVTAKGMPKLTRSYFLGV
jgi:hypothetical protein